MPILPENRARYPADWKAISHRIRFERAGGRCECLGECGQAHHGGTGDPQRCVRRHGETVPETTTVTILTVGHLDHEPEHCADENLRAWCQGCHNRYDRPHRTATRARQVERRGQLVLLEENPR